MDPTTKVTTTPVAPTKDLKSGKKIEIPPDAQQFQKVLDDQNQSGKGKGGGGSKNSLAKEGAAEETAPLISPFDLPKTSGKKIAKSTTEAIPLQADSETKNVAEPVLPFTLENQVKSLPESPAPKQIPTEIPKELPIPIPTKTESPSPFPSKTTTKKNEPKVSFSKEMPDLSHVNPLGVQNTTVVPIEPIVYKEATPLPQVDIKKIIAEIVSGIETMTNAGKTETTITLKGSPLLQGATVVITSFASAPKEFNVSFENLSTDAKKIMDLPNNQQSLRTGFETNGMVLHIVTVTTQSEHPIYSGDSPQTSLGRQRGQEESEDQQQRKRR